MNTHRFFSKTTAALALGAALIAVSGAFWAHTVQADHHGVSKAVAVLRGTEGNEHIRGTVTFTKQDDGILIEAHVTGLTPGLHGFHVHEWGDISAPDGTSAGGHFNPAGHPHAGPKAGARHVGDLGNIEADENGHAMYKRLDTHVKFEGDHSIIGRAVVVHADADDLESQPTGDAGGRVAIGVVGIAPME